VDTPSVVLAIVLAETAVGGLVLTWLAPTWGKVRHGYELLLGSTLLLMLWGARASLSTPLAVLRDTPADVDVAWIDQLPAVTARADQLELLLLVALGVGVASLLALAVRVPLVARVLGIGSALVGLAAFVPLAQLQVLLNGATLVRGIAELVLGATLLGGIWTGMILGHWYLVERRLSNRYMIWIAWMNVGAVVAGLGAILLSLSNPVPDSLGFSPLLSINSMSVTLGIGTLALVALIAGFNVKLAHEGGRSIQASTGMFYLAVILAPAAEFAAKVRFF